MNRPTTMHFGFDIKQSELFPVPTDEVNAELYSVDQNKTQGDDVSEYV